MLEPAEHYHDIDYYANHVTLHSFLWTQRQFHVNYISDKSSNYCRAHDQSKKDHLASSWPEMGRFSEMKLNLLLHKMAK